MPKIQTSEEIRKPAAFSIMQWIVSEIDEIVISGSDGYYRSRSEFVEKKLLEAINQVKDNQKEQLNKIDIK